MKPQASLAVLLSALYLLPSPARGDGGTVRLSERKGGYQITVFTSPTPFRAGPVDVSVFVQDAATGASLPEAQVTVRALPRDRPEEASRHPATTEAATNKLFHAAVFELPEAGWWEIEVAVEGAKGPVQIRLAVEAADPAPQWPALWAWIGWPGLAVALYGCHRRLVQRRRFSAGSQNRAGTVDPGPTGTPPNVADSFDSFDHKGPGSKHRMN